MEIRPATAADLDSLVPLQREVQQLHLAAHPEIYRLPTDEEFKANMRQLFEREETTIWGAFGAESPLGFVVTVLQDVEHPFALPTRFLKIEQMAVSRAARRQGVGRALMAAVRAYAREEGCQSLRLDVLEFNDKAKAFYISEGFEPLRMYMTQRLTEPDA